MTGPLAYQREEQRVPMDGESGGWSFTLNTTHLVSQATHSFSWQKVPGEKSNFFFIYSHRVDVLCLRKIELK